MPSRKVGLPCLAMELRVAEVKRGVDRLVGLEVNVDLLLLPFLGQDGTTEDDETILRHSVVELELLLGRGDGAQNGESIHTVLDVGSGSVLIRKHFAI